MKVTKQTVSNLIKELQKLEEEHGSLPVVTSSDDEGNAFNVVFYNPTPLENIPIENLQGKTIKKCICIN